jgi:hypothetical protein
MDHTILEDKETDHSKIPLQEKDFADHIETASIKWTARSMKQEISQFRIFLHRQTVV